MIYEGLARILRSFLSNNNRRYANKKESEKDEE